MSVEGNVIWFGASERPYRYQVFSIDSEFESVDAVYLLTRKVGRNWRCVAIGKGNIDELNSYRTSAQRWIDGVTHVHVRYTASPISRLLQANDIRVGLELRRIRRQDREPARRTSDEAFVYVDQV
ncbi:MAG: hypothetical protein KDD65_02965 [Bacteroidetes bacterium]|nr:hypothetical protein [Bacteroidota bacterium]